MVEFCEWCGENEAMVFFQGQDVCDNCYEAEVDGRAHDEDLAVW